MTAFILLAALMTLAALALLSRPLWWRTTPVAPDDATRTLADAREQLRQLDALHASGTLTDAQAAEARARLEQRIGQALTRPAQPPSAAAPRSTSMLSALSLFVLVVVVAGYATLGTPQALDPAVRAAGSDSGTGHPITMEQIEDMTGKLAARLKEQPDDVDGWAMLGRSYAVLGKHPLAMAAFKQAVTLKPDDAVLLADYADSMAVVNGRNLEGEPSRLIARALELDPNNLKALSLAGTAAFMRKDYTLALQHWERMQKVAPDSEFAKQIQGGIEEARSLAAAAGQPVPARSESVEAKAPAPQAAGGERITGVVKLSAGLASKAAPDDTVFVYARAAQGPRMPLAILRRQVKDLPLQFALDDSMAMSPAARLSSAQQVVVSARISKSGNAMPQPGDLLGESAPVTPGTKGLTLEIGQVFSQ
ncbi:MAG TPA: c-type cytochrome biogenesis protein CcmI [Burkholderiaceae bacterium]|nr:c-type cytochrome biogenesis protein CcmI [Burkholderiaceae bacterium]